MKKKLSLFMTFALLFSACAGTASAASPANNAKKENVITMTVPSDYDYVYDRLNEVFGAHVEMEAPVEEVLPLVQPDVEIVKESGVTEAPVMEAPAEAVVEEAVVEESAAAPQTGTGDSGDYSGTNVQVEGIDEGDIVKTDGEYIYVLKQSTDELVILAADGAETRVLSRKQTNAGYTITPDNYRNRTKHTGITVTNPWRKTRRSFTCTATTPLFCCPVIPASKPEPVVYISTHPRNTRSLKSTTCPIPQLRCTSPASVRAETAKPAV